MDMYRATILEHFKHPRNSGTIENPSAKARLHNTSCGDVIEISILLSKDGKTLDDVKFTGEGCAISVASASLLTDLVKGMTLVKAKKIQPRDIYEALGTELTATRTKCALLSLEVFQKALLEAGVKITV